MNANLVGGKILIKPNRLVTKKSKGHRVKGQGQQKE